MATLAPYFKNQHSLFVNRQSNLLTIDEQGVPIAEVEWPPRRRSWAANQGLRANHLGGRGQGDACRQGSPLLCVQLCNSLKCVADIGVGFFQGIAFG